MLPASVHAHIWRGNEMGGRSSAVVASGFRPLDNELPGGGWPCQSLTEILVEPGAHCEWRLLAACIKRIQKRGGSVMMVGTPQTPHLAGLRLMGIDERKLVWVQAESMRERLWATQQIIQSGQAGAIMAWLPQADARALRRLQACTQACEAPVFVMRPAAMQQGTSPAPLRVEVALGDHAWTLRLRIVKRRGPPLDRVIELPSVPGGLTQVLARRAASMESKRLQVQTPLPLPVPAFSTRPSLIPLPTSTPTPTPPAIPIPFHHLLSTQPTSEESLNELLAGAVLPTLLRVAS